MVFEGLLIACTILGGIAATMQLWKGIQERRGRFGWRRVTSAVKKLIEMIQQDDFRPDVIVGLGRGGFVVAAMLSGNLGVITLAGLDRRYIWHGRHRHTKIIDLGKLSLQDKKVLLVVAEPYTGETLRNAYEYLKQRGAGTIRTASLFRSEICAFVPDYYAYEVKQVTQLPWRLNHLYVRDSKDPEHKARYLDDELPLEVSVNRGKGEV